MIKRAAPSTAFKPGQSGNPGGRPKAIVEVQELARRETAASIAALVRIRDAEDTPPAAVVAAATALLDRGWGKPVHSHELRHNFPSASAADADLLAIALGGGSVACIAG